MFILNLLRKCQEAFIELGNKLKSFRKSKGLSLKELSNSTNGQISVSIFSDIENGRSNPSLDKIKLLAETLNVPTSYFIEYSEQNIFTVAIEDTEFFPVVELLKDFRDWNIEDKKELLYYLKAKKVIRDNK